MTNRNLLRNLTLLLLSATILLSAYEAGKSLLQPEVPVPQLLHIVIIISGLITLSTAFVNQRWEARMTAALAAEADRSSKAAGAARNALQYTRSVIDSSMDMIIAADSDRHIVEFNRIACKRFGYESEEILGQPVDILYSRAEDGTRVHDALVKDGSFAGEVTNRHKDGTPFTCYLSASRLLDPSGQPCGFMGISRDVSERNRMEAALQRAATTDQLTGICNRYKFEESLKTEMDRSKRYQTSLSLLIFDIDHFKEVNDAHGHLAGDAVLKTLTEIVQGHIRKTDCFCRWGGEEFCILAPQTTRDQAVVGMEKIRNLVAGHHFSDGVRLTISGGLAMLRADDTNERLIKRADDALYRAKANGRNRIECETPA